MRDAGTMILFNGAVWHGHTANITRCQRRSIQGYFFTPKRPLGIRLSHTNTSLGFNPHEPLPAIFVVPLTTSRGFFDLVSVVNALSWVMGLRPIPVKSLFWRAPVGQGAICMVRRLVASEK